jgi:predicted enzyme involved in methoxymalonyl-ACP biosynthesis
VACEKFILETLESDDRNLLKPQYLSAWKINWENKADNIKKISKQLNIGLDSIVFIDDSEYECKLET